MTIPHGQERQARVPCKRFVICNGVRSHLMLARRHNHSRETLPLQTFFSLFLALMLMILQWLLRPFGCC